MNLLIILSLFIYFIYGKSGIIYTLLVSIISYLFARSNKKRLIIIAIIFNIIGLIFYKSIILCDSNIIIPLGISYYTLQLISYLVDIYNEKLVSERNFKYFILYLLYFPSLFIGPIKRYIDFKKDVDNRKKISTKIFINSILRICIGLFKKLVIASRINILILSIVDNDYSGLFVLFALFMYSFEIYSDFSGGIDIVIGISNLFGIKLEENFNLPFLSENLKQFWNNWHITLRNWLKDYVYIPLGGNRKGKIRKKINLLITFFVSGLWHGINYIYWGIYHGIFISLQKMTNNKYLNRFITFMLVSISWCFFIYPNSYIAIDKVISIFRVFNISDFINNFFNFGLNLYDYIILFVSLIILFIFDLKKDKFYILHIDKKILLICILLLCITVYGIYGIGFDKSEFIYSKF